MVWRAVEGYGVRELGYLLNSGSTYTVRSNRDP
jgi:hypothetical protein